MSGPVDLAARRAARTRDARSVSDDIVDAFESGLATASTLALQPITETRIVSLERHIAALGVLVADLRQRVGAPRGAA